MAVWSRAAAVSVVLALVATACTGSSDAPDGDRSGRPSAAGSSSASPSKPPGELSAFYDQQVDWRGCGDGFQCAQVSVPVDYGAPGGRSIDLAVIRLPTNGNDRLGSLLLNPGGPGVSGVDYARAASRVVTKNVRDHYDVVGFDPRGVGESAPIRCLTDSQTDQFIAQDGSPDDAAEQAELLRLSRALGERCAARNGGLLAHVGTADAARDLDVLRAVLGDKQLNYLGKSYGTFLGATYAELFPGNVGRVVLDGVLDPAASTTTLARAQALGFERALASFVDDCLGRNSCPFSGDRADALDQVSDLLDAVDRRPLRARRPVVQSLAVLGIAYAMYEKSLWQVLREALGRAKNGNGDILLLLADSYAHRTGRGHYPSNVNDAIYAVNCLDRPETSDVDEVRERASRLAKIAPRFGAYSAWSYLPCSFWPVEPQGSPGPVHASGAAPILVVGTTRDPATPYAFAKHLADELDAARLLTYVGDGHTAYEQGSDCIDEAVDGFLVDGKLPAEGLRCR